jgi:hypothetical protein
MNAKEEVAKGLSDIMIFETSPPLEAITIPTIKTTIIELETLQQRQLDEEEEADKRLLGKRWRDNFKRNLVSRRVELFRARVWEQKTAYWKQEVLKNLFKTEGQFGNIILERIGKEVTEHVHATFRMEWDRGILSNLEQNRRKIKGYDSILAFAVYYNPDIPSTERERRLNTLNPRVVDQVLD